MSDPAEPPPQSPPDTDAPPPREQQPASAEQQPASADDSGYAQTLPYPPYAQPGQSAQYAPTQQYPQSQQYGPPASYGPPVQYGQPAQYEQPPQYAQPGPYAPPYVAPSPPVAQPMPQPPGSPLLGVIALVLAVLAAVGASILGAVAAWQVGVGAARELTTRTAADIDWSVLTPVRDWVLLGEISFWAGTVLGTAALVLGIIAIVKNRGRAAGIVAVVLAGLGPILFFVGLQIALSTAIPAGFGLDGFLG